MEQSNGAQWFLVIVCCSPLMLGFIGGVVTTIRVMQLGWWGLLPFGGVFKQHWMDKQG